MEVAWTRGRCVQVVVVKNGALTTGLMWGVRERGAEDESKGLGQNYWKMRWAGVGGEMRG